MSEKASVEKGVILLEKDILGIVKEKKPFYKIWNAVVFPNSGRIESVCPITKEECLGHFDEDINSKHIYIPLIRISEMMAQTGLLYVSYITRDTNRTPLAIGHGAGSALSKKLIRPPVKIRVEAQKAHGHFVKRVMFYVMKRIPSFVMDIKVINADTGETIAELKKVLYILSRIPRF